jgi:hypothetical protein
LLLLGWIVSWLGEGLRGPLRDAILIQAVSPQTRGRAFDFHRATDTIGAVVVSSATEGVIWTMISPVLGFGLTEGMMVIGTFAFLRVKRQKIQLHKNHQSNFHLYMDTFLFLNGAKGLQWIAVFETMRVC